MTGSYEDIGFLLAKVKLILLAWMHGLLKFCPFRCSRIECDQMKSIDLLGMV